MIVLRMDEKLVFRISVLLFVALAAGCTTKKEHHDHRDDDSISTENSWKEMDTFHAIMAESFHPYNDSANLEPAKANARAMAAEAVKWLDAPLPKKVDNQHVKMKLQQLQLDAATFAEISGSADDRTVGESLTKLHDLFHELQEAWYTGDDEHEDHH
jgi:hypothetical protein